MNYRMLAASGNYQIVGAVGVNDPVQGPVPVNHYSLAADSGRYVWNIADRVTIDNVPAPLRQFSMSAAGGVYALTGRAAILTSTVAPKKKPRGNAGWK